MKSRCAQQRAPGLKFNKLGCYEHAGIEEAGRDIGAIAYKLFHLTPEEIALLEASLAGECLMGQCRH